MKKDNMLKGIFKLITATFLMCLVSLFLCKVNALAYAFVEYPEDAETPTGFYIEVDEEESKKGLTLYVEGEPFKKNYAGGKVTYKDVLSFVSKSSTIKIQGGSSIAIDLYGNDGNLIETHASSFEVYRFSDCIELDPNNDTAIGKDNLNYNLEITDKLGYLIGGTEITNPSIFFGNTADFNNKVQGKYYVNSTSDFTNINWQDVSKEYKYKGTFVVGDTQQLFFCPKVGLEIGTSPTDINNLRASSDVDISLFAFLNEDEDGYGSYEGYNGFGSAVTRWTCVDESGVITECYENGGEESGGPKGEVYESDGIVGKDFKLYVTDGSGTTGYSKWKFSIDGISYPSGKSREIVSDKTVTFTFTRSGLCLLYNGKQYAQSGLLDVKASAGTTLSSITLSATSGSLLSDYYDFDINPKSGVASASIASNGQITISNIQSAYEGTSQTYTVSAVNSETGATETIDFILKIIGTPEEMEFADGCDEVTSGLSLRLNKNTLIFYDKSGNVLSDVVIKSVKAEDTDVLEVKKDSSGFYVVGGDAGTSELLLTMEDGSYFITPEITVYPMPTVSYESSRQLKVEMPYKVAIPGSKDSLKQVTGFKLYVYHDGDKLGEFDMADMGLSSYSSSSSDSTSTKTMTVGTAAVEKIITNLANNGKFSGDSMGITFKAVPVGKRKSGGSSTYETNGDKVYGEDSTTVYRVGVSVAGCTVTQSTRYGLNGQEVTFTSDQAATNWTGIGTGAGTATGSTAKYTVGTNTTSNLAIKATANGAGSSTITPGTNSGAANGTGAGGDGLDEVPKTSESNAPIWLIVIVVLAAIGGAYALYLQLRPVADTGYYDYDEDEEDRPNF